MVGMPGFWPGFLALEKTARGGGGARIYGIRKDGRRGGGKYSFTMFYRSTGTEKYSVQAYRVRKLVFFSPPLSPPPLFPAL